MNQDENAFLRELQEACLKEVEDYLNEFREILSTFKDDYLNKIELLQKVIHSMKGNLQAVSFLNFGNYVHQLETILETKSKEMTVTNDKIIPEFELLVCEFLISNILEAMVTYHSDLKNTYTDSEALALARTEQLVALNKWQPKFESASAPLFTPPEQIKHEQPDIENILHFEDAIKAASEKHPDDNENDEIEFADMKASSFIAEPPRVEDIIKDVAKDAIKETHTQAAPEMHVEPPKEIVKESAANEAVAGAAVVPMNSKTELTHDDKNNDWKNYNGSGLFLLFQNQKKYFAIAIEHIVEVIKSQPLSSPPHRRKNLSGLLNLRGEVLPILKVEEILSEQQSHPTYVVVSQINDMRFGFQVETVHQVVTLDPMQFQAVDGISNSDNSIVTHFCQTEDKTISILKLKELVAA